MTKRFIFQCWNCSRIYTLFREITGRQTLMVACPFCDEEAVVKLDPYIKEKISVLKGDTDKEQAIGYEYQFPDVIPTHKPD